MSAKAVTRSQAESKTKDDSHGNRGSYPRVRAGKGAGQMWNRLWVRAEVQPKNQMRMKPGTFHIAQAAGKFQPSPDGVLLDVCSRSSWLRVPFAPHKILPTHFLIVQVFYVLNALKAASIKLFLPESVPICRNARSKLKRIVFLFKLPRKCNISFCNIMKESKNFHSCQLYKIPE